MSSAEKLDQAMTLTEYLVFWQDEVRVEQHTRTPDGLWLLRETTGLDAVLHLASIDCPLALREVYDKVDLTADERS